MQIEEVKLYRKRTKMVSRYIFNFDIFKDYNKMERRNVKDLYLRVKDKNGTEAWISLEELGKVLFETILDTGNNIIPK